MAASTGNGKRMPKASGSANSLQRFQLRAACLRSDSRVASVVLPGRNCTHAPPGSLRRSRTSMELREFFSEDAVKLNLEGDTKDDVLKELIGLLRLDDKSEGMLFKMLKRRENLGSTGIGRGIAIPHCRSL